jgi:hypothetical protein
MVMFLLFSVRVPKGRTQFLPNPIEVKKFRMRTLGFSTASRFG